MDDQDLTQLLLNQQAQQPRSSSSVPAGGITIEVVVLSYRNKSNQWKKPDGTIVPIPSTSALVQPKGLLRLGQQVAHMRSSPVVPTPEGIRFTRTGDIAKVRDFQTLKNGLDYYKWKQQQESSQAVDAEGNPVPVKIEPSAFPRPADFVPAKKDDKLSQKVFADLRVQPFVESPMLHIKDETPFWVDIKGTVTPSEYALYLLEGLHVEVYSKDNSLDTNKSNNNRGTSAVAPPQEDYTDAPDAFAPDPDDALDTGFGNSVKGAAMLQDDVDWSKIDLVDPLTNFSLRFTLKASGLTESAAAVVTKAPQEIRLEQLFDPNKQHFVNPAETGLTKDLRNITVALMSDKPQKAEYSQRGSFVGVNNYARQLQGDKVSSMNDVETYYYEDQKKVQSAMTPIDFRVTEYEFFSTETDEDSIKELGYTNVIPMPSKSKLMATRQINVKGGLYAQHCRTSGIANLEAWKLVNAWRPIPFRLVLKPNPKKIQPGTFMAQVLTAAPYMYDYLSANAIKIPFSFVSEIFSKLSVVQCTPPLGTEMVKQYSKDKVEEVPKDIENLANKSRRFRDLANLSELTGDITIYSDPSWELFLLLAPIAADIREYDQEKRDLFNKYLEAAIAAKTPDEGEAAVRTFLKEVFGTQYKTTALAYKRRMDFCSNVFAAKDPRKASYMKGVTPDKPYYKNFEPVPPKPPVENKQPEPVAESTPDTQPMDVDPPQATQAPPQVQEEIPTTQPTQPLEQEEGEVMEVDVPAQVPTSPKSPTSPSKKRPREESNVEEDDDLSVEERKERHKLKADKDKKKKSSHKKSRTGDH